MVWVSELEYFNDLFRSETQELDVLEEEWTKNRVSESCKKIINHASLAMLDIAKLLPYQDTAKQEEDVHCGDERPRRVVKGYHQFNGELALVRFSNARFFFQLRDMVTRVVKGYHQFNGELALVRFFKC